MLDRASLSLRPSADKTWLGRPDPLAQADPADKATNKDLPHPLFVYIEEHEPEFLRDLGL